MGKISGTLAVLAGLFMLLPGLFVMMQDASAAPMPGWIVRDLIVFSLTGVALLFWGGFIIRRRELEMHELPIRVRARR